MTWKMIMKIGKSIHEAHTKSTLLSKKNSLNQIQHFSLEKFLFQNYEIWIERLHFSRLGDDKRKVNIDINLRCEPLVQTK